MLQPSARDEYRHVGRGVLVGVTEIAAVHHDGVLQKITIGLLDVLEVADEFAEQFHLLTVDGVELCEFVRVHAVVRKVVVAVGDLRAGDLDRGRVVAVHQ